MNSANLLQLQNANKSFGLQTLFENATFSVNVGEHIGVIGPNGAGKSTLFKILIGQEDLDQGQIIRSQNLSLGYLSQHDEWSAIETGNSYLEKVCKIPVWEAKSAGRALRVTEDIFARPIVSLSGGYRMRIKLIGLLGMRPNLMLLDEPTNYLDLETTILLESFLQSYAGSFLLISHDREVLRRTTDHTLEVESGEITKFNGHIDDYFEQKELLRTQLQAQAQNQQIQRKAILDFVSRFGAKATKARQAQSRLKQLEKMENIEIKPLPIKAALKIPPPPHVGRILLKLNECEFGYATAQNAVSILKNVSLEIKKGEHVAVIGLNGAGKSTLLKGLAGTLKPLKGSREVGHGAQIAIFNQHVVEVLDPNQTVYESLSSATNNLVTPQDIRNMAGSLLFSADTIEKKVRVLSGGEKSRVALGQILLQKVPCLLLDEPTNHLDFQTVEALTQALNSYEGTLIVVSHDRSFIRRVGTKILEVRAGQVNVYPGTYDDYVWKLQNDLISIEDASSPEVNKSQPTQINQETNFSERKEQQKRLRLLQKKIDSIQMKIEKLETMNIDLNTKIASSEEGPTQDLIKTLSDNSLEIQKLESEWVQTAEEIESLQESTS